MDINPIFILSRGKIGCIAEIPPPLRFEKIKKEGLENDKKRISPSIGKYSGPKRGKREPPTKF